MKNKTIVIKGFKFIGSDMKSQNGNHKWEVGKWYKHDGKLEICSSGFHACRTPLQSLKYVYGDKWFIIESRRKIIDEKDDKFVCSEMRLIKEIPIAKVVKPFAIWCAKQCLINYTKQYPNDKRVSEAIEGAELYLDGKIDLKELNTRLSAARSAARSAESAARSAAWSAESAAWSAESAARSAAWSAESAARSAAWSAAWSAESAAWSAESAARSAARSAQNKELLRLIKENVK